MANSRELRPTERPADAGRLRTLARALVGAALLVLLLALAGCGGGERSARPGFLTNALGAPQQAPRLSRTPQRRVSVSVDRHGYTVRRHGAGAVELAAPSRGGAWQGFENGVSRPTPFGSETVTVSKERTEEFLTVHRRQGVRTWTWTLRTLDLEPRSRSNGRIDLAGADGVVRMSIAPVAVLDAAGRDVTPAGLRWSIARTGSHHVLRLRLDDRKLALPYTIDPAVDYPSPLYLSSTASTETGSWRLLTAAPSAADSSTDATPPRMTTGYYLFMPGVSNTTAGTPSATPSGTGFVVDQQGGTGIPSGPWSFTLTATNSSGASGTGVFAVGIWKGTISGGAFTAVGAPVLAVTDDPAGQNIYAAPTTTYTVTYPNVPAVNLAANERLYVEVWMDQTAGNGNGAAKNRIVNFVVNDGVAQVVHPAADDVAPTHAFSVAVGSGGAYFTNPGGATGTIYYRGSAAGSFTISDAVADAGSGAKQVVYPAPGGSLTHASQTVTSGPSFTSSAYTWSAGGTTSPGGQAIVAQDNALNPSTAVNPITITNDTSLPTGQSVALTSPPAWYTTASVGLTPTDGSDTGSGIDTTTRVYQRDETTMTAGACNAFPGTWTTVSNPDATVQSGKCYRYRMAISDRVGNQSAWSAASGTARVDLAAPTAPTLTFGSPVNAYATGSTVYYRPGVAGSFVVTASGSTDAASGLSSYAFPSFWTTAGSGASRTYSWSGTPAAPGAQTVTPVDVAGLSGPGASFTPTADSSLPTTGDDSASIGSAWKTAAQTVTLTPSDTGSGVQSTYFTTDGSTPTTSSSSGTSVALAGDGTYTVRYFSVDRVGNSEAVKTAGTQIRIDTTPPSTATLTALPAAIRNGQALTATAADATSGVQDVTYYSCAGAGCTPSTSIGSSAAGPGYSVTWSSQPADGTYRVLARVRDNAGLTRDSAIQTVTIDNTAPTAAIGAKPANPSNTAAPSFGFSSPDGTATFQCRLDGGSFAACTSPKSYAGIADGSHTFDVQAVDPAGNTSTAQSFTWTVDTAAPDATLGTKPANPSASAAASFAFSSSDGTATFECKLDAGSFAACTSPKAYAGLAEGSHTFAVHARDAAGNTSADQTWTWTVDTVAPPVSLDAKPASPSSSTGPSFAFSSTDGSATFECKLDGGAFGACTSPKSYAGLAAGAHTFAVHAKDAAGNTSADATWTWTIDTTPPTTPVLTPSASGPSVFYGSGSTVWFRPGAGGANVVSVTAASSEPETAISGWSFPTLPGFILGGSGATRTYTASAPTAGDGGSGSVTATNTAGLTSGAASFTLAADSTAPGGGSISGLPAHDADGTFSFDVATDSDGESGVATQTLTREKAALAGDACGAFSADGAVALAGTVNQSGLTGPFCYRYVLVTTDMVGNAHTITSAAVEVDTTAPSAPTLTPSASGANVHLGSGSTVWFKPGADGTNVVTIAAASSEPDTAITGWSFPALAGFTPGGSGATRTYTANAPAAGDGGTGGVSATNAAGLTSGAASFTLAPDGTSPGGGSISGLPAHDDDGAFSFSVATDSDGGSGLASQTLRRQKATLAADGCGTFADDGAVGIAGTVVESGLAGPACYRYVLTATDNVGNLDTITSATVKVDTTAPTAPGLTPSTAGGGLYYAGSGTTVWFRPGIGSGSVVTLAAATSEPDTAITTWTFPALPGFTLGGSGATRTYTAASPTAGDGGNGSVTATNSAGLQSAGSSFSLTPDAGLPAGGSISGVPAYDTDGSFSFSVTADADALSGIASQTLTREKASLAADACTGWTTDGAVTLGTTVGESALAGPACYRYVLTATDNVGNVDTITSSAVEVDKTAPSTPTLALSASGGDVYYPGSGATAWFRPGAGGSSSLSVTASSSDADTGIGSWSFPALAGFTLSGSGASRAYTAAAPLAGDGGSGAVNASNRAGLTSGDATLTLTADATAPTSALSFPADGASYSAAGWTGAIAGTAGDTGGSGLAATEVSIAHGGSCWDGSAFAAACPAWRATGGSAAAWSLAFVPPADGSYTVSVRVTDNVGNAGTATTASFAYDTTAPSLQNASIAADGTQVTVTFDEPLDTGVATAGSAFAVTPNGGAAVAGTGTVSYPAANQVRFDLAAPVHYRDTLALSYTRPGAARIADAVGNQAATGSLGDAAIANGADSLAPATPPLGPPADALATTDANPTLAARFADPDGNDTGKVVFEVCSSSTCGAGTVLQTFDSSVTALANGAAGSAAVPGGALADGTYHWRAQAVDSSGARSSFSATRSFTVDTTAPAFQSASVDGATLDVVFDEPLDGGQALANGLFTVRVGGLVRALSGSPSVSSDTVTLTLATGVNHGDTVTVAYAKPGSAPWLQDALGNATASFAAQPVVHGSANTLPTATVALAPSTPTTSQTLTATATKADADGDPVTLTYVWKVGSTVVKTTANSSATTDTLDLSAAGHGDHGDTVTVTVTPNDGVGDGTSATDSVTVANSAPSGTVALAPASPKTDAVVSATASGTDADGDTVSFAYVWKLDGVVVAGETGSSFDLAAHGGKGQVLTVVATPSDGTDTGAAASDQVTVANSAPVVDSVSIDEAAPRTNDTLHATVTSHDDDLDTVSLDYQWLAAGTPIPGATGATLDLSQAGNGDRGDRISVRVTPHDDETAGSPLTSAEVTIANTAPVVDSVSIDTAAPRTNDTLHAAVTSHDADGGAPAYVYQWQRNGIDIPFATGSSLDLSQLGHGDRGDQITVTVTADDGDAASAPLTSAASVVANSAPVLDSAAIAESAPRTNDVLHATAAGHDADGDTLTYSYQWARNGSDIPGATAPTLDLSQAGNGDHGDTITVTATAHDDTAASSPLASAAVAVRNTPPGATVALTPASPTTDALVTATATGSDDDGDAVTFAYTWKLDGSTVAGATGPTFDLAAHGAKGQTVTVEATPSDGADTGPAATDQVTVANSAPTATVSLNSASPKTNDTLVATVATADADGDTVTPAFVWKLDGAVVPGATGSTFDLSAYGSRGQTVSVEATPNDGEVDGAVASASAVVANSAPVVDSVAIDQAAPLTGDTLTATVAAHDDDGDPVTLAYQWTRNGALLVGQNGATLDLAGFGHGDHGDRIAVVVTGSDDAATGAPLASAPVTVGNSAPAATVSLDRAAPTTGETLTATATGTDADLDAVRFTYVWSVDGTPVKTTAATLATTDTLDLSQPGFGDRGQTVSVAVTPSDGSDAGAAASAAATVANSAPTLSVGLDDSAPRSNASLTASATASDADGDPVTLTYVWKVNGATVQTTGPTSAAADTLDLAVSGHGDDGDTVTVEVTASDGTDPSPTRSATATVGVNHLPVATVSLSTAAPKTGDTLTATATKADGDGDPVALTYVWKVDGTTVRTTGPTAAPTDSLDLGVAGHGDRGQTVTVTVTPNDGLADGSAVTGTATVANSAPVVDSVSIDEAAPPTGDMLHVTVSAHDDDGDALTYGYQWRKDGSPIVGATGSTLDLSAPGNGDRGQAIAVDVTAGDGSATSPALRSAAVTVVDSAPTATVSLPAGPRTNDTVTATTTKADADGDPVTLAYVWKLDGTAVPGETGPSFDLGAHGGKGQVLSVEVTPGDGTVSGTPATDSTTVADTPPAATVSLGPAQARAGDLLTATATTSDDDGDPVTLSYAWSVNGTTVAGATGSTFDLTAHAARGDTVAVSATPHDGTLAGVAATDSLVVANTPPTATVTLAPAAPKTGDTVTAAATAGDADGDAVSVSYLWKVDGAVVAGATGPTLDLSQAGHGDAGQVVSVEATPNDGTDDGAPATAQVTVADTAPTATVALDNTTPKTDDTLTATATPADPDGGAVTLTYVWTVDGVTRKTTTTTAVADTFDLGPAGHGDRGQTVTVTVTPSDGSANGVATSDSATVENSAPSVAVAFDSAGPRTNATLTATVTAADPDGDAIALTYDWKVNGTTVKTTGPTTAATDTLDLSAPGHGDDGDVVTVDVAASDGTASAGPATATADVGVDTPPTATVSLDSAAPRTNDTLTATATKADADGDPVTLTYVWKVDGTTVRTTGPTAATTDSLDLSVAGNGDRGQAVTVEVVPHDGYAAGAAATASATVANTAPVVDSVTIDQAAPHTNDTLTATIVAHDADGDALTIGYQWLKDGAPLIGRQAATLDLSQLGNGDRGESIALDATVTDGVATTPALRAGAVTILDSAPTATVTLDPAAPTTDQTVTATVTTADADGDFPIAVAWSWTVAGGAVAGANGASLDLGSAGQGDKGQVVAVSAVPHDGTLAGAAAGAAVTVANSAPTVALASPADGALLATRTPALAATYADPDGDGGQLDFRVCTDPGCATVLDTFSSASGLASGSQGGGSVAAGALAADGGFFWQARATDADGASSAWSPVRSLAVDTTPPSVQVGSGPADPAAAATATFAFSAEPGATLECSLDGGAFAACASPASRSGLADGSHAFRVRATDAAGNQAVATHTWTVDTTDPTIAFASPSGRWVAGPTPVSVTAGDAGTGVVSVDFQQCSNTSAGCATGVWSSFGTATTAPYSVPWPLPGDGNRALRAVATDGVGNTAAATLDVVVDQTAPTATLTAPGPFLRGSVALSAVADDATSGVNTVDFQTSPAGAGTWTTIAQATSAPYGATLDTTALADGDYDLRVFVTDRAGNVFTHQLAAPVKIDNTPPTAALAAPPAYVSAGTTLTSTQSDAGGSGVDTVTYQYRALGASTWTTTPAAWDASALPEGAYELRVVVRDRAGNETDTADGVTAYVDHTKPATTDDADALWHREDVTVHLAADDPADANGRASGVARSEYSVDGGPYVTGSTVLVPAAADHSWDGEHTIAYRSYDVAGNVEDARSTTVKIDTTAPSASLADTGTNLRGTLTFSSTTDDVNPLGAGKPAAGVASVGYQAQPAGGDWSAATTLPATFDTSSLPDGVYDFRVLAVDAAGNGFASPAVLAKRIDNTAPTTTDDAPGGSQASAVTVTLSPSDAGSGVASTSYTVDGGPVQSGTSVTVAAPSDHSNDGAHTIDYWSTDAAGNAESHRSTSVVIDTTPPGGPVLDPGSVLRGTVELSATPSDADVASVKFQSSPAGAGAWTTIATATTAPYRTEWDTTAVADGSYDLRVVVTDAAANATTTSLPGKTVDNTAPAAAVTAPAAGALVSGAVNLSASASDATSGVASVEFQVKTSGAAGFTTVATDTASPWTTAWDSRGAPDGPVDVRVVATDVAGNQTISAVRSFGADNNAPTATLTGAPGAAAGVVDLGVSTSADTVSVTYQRSSAGAGVWTDIGTVGSAPFGLAWTTTTLVDGSYDLRAVATDGSGNRGTSATVTVRVDNTAPAGAVTQPANGSNVGGPAVALAATVGDTGSGVASVTFQWRAPAGAWADISTDTSAPYQATWDTTGLASGPYQLQAVVTDAAGNAYATNQVPVNVDATPPTVALAPIAASVSGRIALGATTAGGATRIVYELSPAGASTWTTIASVTSSPWSTTFDTNDVGDGLYDIRATAVDAFGNAASDARAGIRIDNVAPAVVGSTPADGERVDSASAVTLTATEQPSAVTGSRLDGAPVAAPTISGTTVTYAVGQLAEGEHWLTGALADAAGHSKPFRVNFTVWDGGGAAPGIARNVNGSMSSALAALDGSASVTMPAGAYVDPPSGDWLVLRIAPVAPGVVPAPGMAADATIVDVTARWSLEGTLEHHFDRPLEIVLPGPAGGANVPATFEDGAWRAIPALQTPGALPDGWADGFWADGSGFHILTRHLSLFSLLRDLEAPQPPQDFVGVVGEDGLTLRWVPGADNSGVVSQVTLFVNDAGYVNMGPAQFEIKMGAFDAGDTRRFVLREVDGAGNVSGPSAVLAGLPALVGQTLDQARASLAARGFAAGTVRYDASSTAPAGTVVGPADVELRALGSAVDLVVSGKAPPAPPAAKLGFTVVGTKLYVPQARTFVAARVKSTVPAQVVVTLKSPRHARLATWRRSVRPGAQILKLTMPQAGRRPGVYTLAWTARAGGRTVSRTLKLRVAGPRETSAVVRTRPLEVLLLGVGPRKAVALAVGSARVRVVSPGLESAFAIAGSPRRNAAVVAVDVDRYGARTVRDLRTLFPSLRLVAVAGDAGTRAQARRAGANAVLAKPASAAKVARAIRALAALSR